MSNGFGCHLENDLTFSLRSLETHLWHNQADDIGVRLRAELKAKLLNQLFDSLAPLFRLFL